MICVELEFTVAKLPKVFGTVPASVKTRPESRSPVTKYGMVVRLESRSIDENLKGAPEAVTSICALIVGSLAARVKRMKGAGFPKL